MTRHFSCNLLERSSLALTNFLDLPSLHTKKRSSSPFSDHVDRHHMQVLSSSDGSYTRYFFRFRLVTVAPELTGLFSGVSSTVRRLHPYYDEYDPSSPVVDPLAGNKWTASTGDFYN
ncbi:hypothetical protein ABKV19_025738 [Rosa sericea]